MVYVAYSTTIQYPYLIGNARNETKEISLSRFSLVMTDIHYALKMAGKSMTSKVRNNDVEVDINQFIPCSPVLSKAYNTNINFKYCISEKSIKYICKESNMAVFGEGNATAFTNSTEQYKLERYINNNEGVRGNLSFSIHERHSTVLFIWECTLEMISECASQKKK